MEPEARPAWLIRQENGTLAEARTRSFLLDRFWVLERSVDVDGADFIIQRRLTGRSLLDRSPPRLGFVQAKFYSDERTSQYIHLEYVLDRDGKPRSEFFVVCHTGTEDSARTFMLSANDVVKHFEKTGKKHSKPGHFVLKGSAVIDDRFEVVDRTRALGQIDRALRHADFYKNRSFLSWALPRPSGKAPPILSIYEEPIDNWWGDIPSGFKKLRERAGHAQWDLEEVLEKLRAIESSPDPEEAATIAEELEREWGKSVGLPDDLHDPDFQSVVAYHKQRYSQLDQAGLLSAFSALRRKTLERVLADLAPKMPVDHHKVYILTVSYNAKTFRNPHHGSHVKEIAKVWPKPVHGDNFAGWNDAPDSHGVLSKKPGEVRVYFLPGRVSYQKWVRGECVEVEAPWRDKLQSWTESLVGKLLDAVLTVRFGEIG